MMSDTHEWYYAQSGTSVGPVSQDAFDRLIANGTIRPDTLVWQDGMVDWLPLGQVPGIASTVGTAASPVAVQTSPQGRSDASTFVGSLKDGIARYVDFRSRSNRPQFWWWLVWNFILSIAAGILDSVLGTSVSPAQNGMSPGMGAQDVGIISGLLSLFLFLPSIAVSVRRLHDIGRTGWWYLMVFIPIVGWLVLLVFFCTRSDPQPNKWGPVPA